MFVSVGAFRSRTALDVNAMAKFLQRCFVISVVHIVVADVARLHDKPALPTLPSFRTLGDMAEELINDPAACLPRLGLAMDHTVPTVGPLEKPYPYEIVVARMCTVGEIDCR
jgi:hypothetical protein